MAILTLTSAGGSPGVTTLAVGFALTWPRPVLLADGDPGAHQAVLAGFLAGRVAANGKGLLRIAEAHRDRRPLREVIIDQTLPLAEDESIRRLFLPGFTKPGSAAHFGAVWPDLAEAFDRLADVDVDVIVDAGRLSPLGLPPALVERSAVTAVVVGSSLRAVMTARVHLPLLRDQNRWARTAATRSASSWSGRTVRTRGARSPRPLTRPSSTRSRTIRRRPRTCRTVLLVTGASMPHRWYERWLTSALSWPRLCSGRPTW